MGWQYDPDADLLEEIEAFLRAEFEARMALVIRARGDQTFALARFVPGEEMTVSEIREEEKLLVHAFSNVLYAASGPRFVQVSALQALERLLYGFLGRCEGWDPQGLLVRSDFFQGLDPGEALNQILSNIAEEICPSPPPTTVGERPTIPAPPRNDGEEADLTPIQDEDIEEITDDELNKPALNLSEK